MQFEVNGIPYFLTFVAEEGSWALLTPTATGIRRMAVETDGPPFLNPLMMDTSEENKKVVN